jgi:hypothetical protein
MMWQALLSPRPEVEAKRAEKRRLSAFFSRVLCLVCWLVTSSNWFVICLAKSPNIRHFWPNEG